MVGNLWQAPELLLDLGHKVVRTGAEAGWEALKRRMKSRGISLSRGKDQQWKDWCQHTRVMGQQGCGKSTLLLHQIKEHMEAGRAVIVLDPHGPLARAALRQVPKDRMNQAIYHRPDAAPLGMNILQLVTGKDAEKEIVVDDVLSLVRHIASHWGDIQDARMEDVLRETLEKEGATLLDALAMFDPKDGAGVRLRKLVSTPTLEKVMTAPPVDLGKVMDEGGAYFLDLGGCAKRTKTILYQLHVIRVQQAAMRRREGSPGVLLVCDEAQRVVKSADALADMLVELRKYSVGIVLAHHYIHQLQVASEAADLIGSQYLFRVTAKDAQALQHIIAPVDPDILKNLPDYHCIRRRQIGGRPEPPSLVRTQPPPKPVLSKAEVRKIVQESRRRYGWREPANTTVPVSESPQTGSNPMSGLGLPDVTEPSSSSSPLIEW